MTREQSDKSRQQLAKQFDAIMDRMLGLPTLFDNDELRIMEQVQDVLSTPSSTALAPMDAEPPKDAEVGYYIEFNRGWWARCLGPNKDRKEKAQTTGHYAGNVTEEEAKELEKHVNDFLGRKGWADGDAQAEIMRGGKDVKITVGGSTHVRQIREWHALAVASFAPSATAAGEPTALEQATQRAEIAEAVNRIFRKALLDISLCRMTANGSRGAVSMEKFGPWAREIATEAIVGGISGGYVHSDISREQQK